MLLQQNPYLRMVIFIFGVKNNEPYLFRFLFIEEMKAGDHLGNQRVGRVGLY